MADVATEFRGEDESAGAASPALDLWAAVFLFVLGSMFAVMSLALPVPDKTLSAPGLLPFLTSASLCIMSVILGVSARHRNARARAQVPIFALESQRRILAALVVAGYLVLLQHLGLEGFVPMFEWQVPMGGFEPATILLLTVLLRLFWTERLLPVIAVAVGWTFCLSLSFRGLFGIPLPG